MQQKQINMEMIVSPNQRADEIMIVVDTHAARVLTAAVACFDNEELKELYNKLANLVPEPFHAYEHHNDSFERLIAYDSLVVK